MCICRKTAKASLLLSFYVFDGFSSSRFFFFWCNYKVAVTINALIKKNLYAQNKKKFQENSTSAIAATAASKTKQFVLRISWLVWKFCLLHDDSIPFFRFISCGFFFMVFNFILCGIYVDLVNRLKWWVHTLCI